MFVSKKEWEEKCDTNRALIKDKESKIELIERLRGQLVYSDNNLELAKKEIHDKNDIINIQNERINSLSVNNDMLMETNRKLTEWINKIINEVGIYEVHDRKSITIPIYKNPVKAAFGKIDDIKANMENFMAQEEIIIPEIRFIKMK